MKFAAIATTILPLLATTATAAATGKTPSVPANKQCKEAQLILTGDGKDKSTKCHHVYNRYRISLDGKCHEVPSDKNFPSYKAQWSHGLMEITVFENPKCGGSWSAHNLDSYKLTGLSSECDIVSNWRPHALTAVCIDPKNAAQKAQTTFKLTLPSPTPSTTPSASPAAPHAKSNTKCPSIVLAGFMNNKCSGKPALENVEVTTDGHCKNMKLGGFQASGFAYLNIDGTIDAKVFMSENCKGNPVVQKPAVKQNKCESAHVMIMDLGLEMHCGTATTAALPSASAAAVPSPSNTVSPSVSSAPSNTASPSISSTPSTSASPSVSSTPSMSASPSVSSVPSVSASPSITPATSSSTTPSAKPTPSKSAATAAKSTGSSNTKPANKQCKEAQLILTGDGKDKATKCHHVYNQYRISLDGKCHEVPSDKNFPSYKAQWSHGLMDITVFENPKCGGSWSAHNLDSYKLTGLSSECDIVSEWRPHALTAVCIDPNNAAQKAQTTFQITLPSPTPSTTPSASPAAPHAKTNTKCPSIVLAGFMNNKCTGKPALENVEVATDGHCKNMKLGGFQASGFAYLNVDGTIDAKVFMSENCKGNPVVQKPAVKQNKCESAHVMIMDLGLEMHCGTATTAALPSASAAAVPSPSNTAAPTVSSTPSFTASPSVSSTPTPTATTSQTAPAVKTVSSASPIATPSASGVVVPSTSGSPSVAASSSPAKSSVPSAVPSSAPSSSPAQSSVPSASPSAAASSSPVQSSAPSASPSGAAASQSPAKSSAPSAPPSAAPSSSPAKSVAPSATPSPAASQSPAAVVVAAVVTAPVVTATHVAPKVVASTTVSAQVVASSTVSAQVVVTPIPQVQIVAPSPAPTYIMTCAERFPGQTSSTMQCCRWGDNKCPGLDKCMLDDCKASEVSTHSTSTSTTQTQQQTSQAMKCGDRYHGSHIDAQKPCCRHGSNACGNGLLKCMEKNCLKDGKSTSTMSTSHHVAQASTTLITCAEKKILDVGSLGSCNIHETMVCCRHSGECGDVAKCQTKNCCTK